MADNDWKVLRTIDVTLAPSEEMVGGWKVLRTIDVTLVPSEEMIGGWKVLGTIDVTLTPSEEIVGGWKVLKTIDVVLMPPGLPPVCGTDADCPLGYKCVNGKCVKKEPSEVPWPWIAAGALAAGGVVLLTGKEKPKKK